MLGLDGVDGCEGCRIVGQELLGGFGGCRLGLLQWASPAGVNAVGSPRWLQLLLLHSVELLLQEVLLLALLLVEFLLFLLVPLHTQLLLFWRDANLVLHLVAVLLGQLLSCKFGCLVELGLSRE